ncbi:hypothetical protein TWF694_001283 [Orbilia ellipsospora]|uniref:Uncharacterized protein n=1 Tax=Orbilia ellipsospora TaxID=2528407 RepID=A0AAV9XR70_9PEZI
MLSRFPKFAFKHRLLQPVSAVVYQLTSYRRPSQLSISPNLTFQRSFRVPSFNMSNKVAILTENAPPPFPVYSQAIVHEKTVYVSGQLGMLPDGQGKLLEGSISVRADQALKNLGAVLEAAGSSMDKVLKVVVFLTDMKDFQEVNSVYKNYFGDVKPARSCIAVHQLPLGTDVEIECVAHL